MNIQSKRYRVKSLGFNMVELTALSSGRTHQCPADPLPSVSELARITEAQFDNIMQREMS